MVRPLHVTEEMQALSDAVVHPIATDTWVEARFPDTGTVEYAKIHSTLQLQGRDFYMVVTEDATGVTIPQWAVIRILEEPSGDLVEWLLSRQT